MRLIAAILLCFMGFCTIAEAQENARGLLEQAYELVPNDPNQAIRIGEHLLQNAHSDSEQSQALFLSAQSYFTKGNNDQALRFAFRARQKAMQANDRQSVPISVFIAEILRKLQLEQQSAYYLRCAQTDADAQKETALSHWVQSKSLLLSAWTEFENRKPEAALESLRKSGSALAKSRKSNGADQNEIDWGKAKVFTALGQNDSAAYYFGRCFDYCKKNPTQLLDKANLFAEWARLYFQQQQHQKATEVLLDVLPIANKLQQAELQRDINNQLATNYLALNDRASYHAYNQKFLALGVAIGNQEEEATNTAFNLISQEQERRIPDEEKQFATILYISLACLVLVLVFGSIQLARNTSREKRYREILKYLESNSHPMAPVAITSKKQAAKNLVPTETEQQILSKLKKFEASVRFTNKEMSLAALAASLDTNTKYLSEVINRHYHDNFNTYINKLRINYIMEKLQSEPAYRNYKISYLAEESGFSSHSSFATIFKSITGIAPTTFIDFLKEEAANKTDS